MRIEEYTQAIEKIGVRAEKKEALIAGLTAAAEARNAPKKRKWMYTLAAAAMFLIVAVPVGILLSFSFMLAGNSPAPAGSSVYGLQEIYERADGAIAVFTEAEISDGLTADGAAYEGYYLTLTGDFDFGAFSYNEGTDGASLCGEEGEEEPLVFDAALSAALSGGALPVGEEKAAVHGELCFVFSLTEEQYGCLAVAESGVYIRLLLGDCREETDGETAPVQFRFAADRIAVQEK